MRNLIISSQILEKLETKHNVCRREVEQCFENRVGGFLEDTREGHATDPSTLWFVSETNKSRALKVIFVFKDGNIHLKSAFDANDKAKQIYRNNAR